MLQALPKKSEGIFGHGRVRDKEHTFQMQRQKRARRNPFPLTPFEGSDPAQSTNPPEWD